MTACVIDSERQTQPPAGLAPVSPAVRARRMSTGVDTASGLSHWPLMMTDGHKVDGQNAGGLGLQWSKIGIAQPEHAL